MSFILLHNPLLLVEKSKIVGFRADKGYARRRELVERFSVTLRVRCNEENTGTLTKCGSNLI